MIKFFKKKTKSNNESYLSNIASLLIHATKIDEMYTFEEKEIIKKTLLKLGAEVNNIDEIITNAESNEEKSNQILDFTRDAKNVSESDKLKIIEALWKIIYSNKNVDIYESNLMRRLAGLLYIDNKSMGEIKERVKKDFSL